LHVTLISTVAYFNTLIICEMQPCNVQVNQKNLLYFNSMHNTQCPKIQRAILYAKLNVNIVVFTTEGKLCHYQHLFNDNAIKYLANSPVSDQQLS